MLQCLHVRIIVVMIEFISSFINLVLAHYVTVTSVAISTLSV